MPVLEAADGKTVCLIVCVPVDSGIARVQVAVESISGRLHR